MKIIEIEKYRNSFLAAFFPISSSIADQVERQPHSIPSLVVSIKNMIEIHKNEAMRSKSFVGKLLGLVTSPFDTEHMRIDGLRLYQCFRYCGIEPSIEIHMKKFYRVDVVALKSIVKKLEDKMHVETTK